jgi:hypothetical protein
VFLVRSHFQLLPTQSHDNQGGSMLFFSFLTVETAKREKTTSKTPMIISEWTDLTHWGWCNWSSRCQPNWCRFRWNCETDQIDAFRRTGSTGVLKNTGLPLTPHIPLSTETPPYRKVVLNDIEKRYSNRHASERAQRRKLRSRFRWFTEFCNSHYLSHFAALFIVARAEISVVKSYLPFMLFFLP